LLAAGFYNVATRFAWMRLLCVITMLYHMLCDDFQSDPIQKSTVSFTHIRHLLHTTRDGTVSRNNWKYT
jgi:hypothetical protein